MRSFLLFAALLTPFSGSAEPSSWTIGNDQVKRVIAFSDSTGLYTNELSDLITHADYVKPDDLLLSRAPEFSFQCDGHVYRGASSEFSLIAAENEKPANANSLIIRLQSKHLPLEVTVTYKVYDGHPAVRKQLAFKNTGVGPMRISHLTIEALAPSIGPSNEVTLDGQYGTMPRETFYTGRSEDAGLLVANAKTGIGFAILSEVPGYMKRTEVSAWSDPHHVQVGALYDTDLMPFERSLAPQETFTTAFVSMVLFRNSDGFRDPHWVLPSFTSKILMQRISAKGSPWIYNTWVPFRRNINEATAVELIEAASDMGLDIFTIDDGWAQEYGDNAVDTKAFPGGLEKLVRLLESKHMRLGLWIPLAAIGTTTADYHNHPDWVALDAEGKQKITSTAGGSKAVMCLATRFRDPAADRINEAIERFHLAYVKLDLTTMFNTYGEAPGCWAKGHLHQSWAESLNMIYEGIAYITNKVHQKHPDVLLDLTFELWGQKHIIDAGLLAAGDLDWLSNVPDGENRSAGPLQARTLLYQRSASMPVDAMLIGNLQAETPGVRERFATELGSAPVLLGDLRRLSVADRKWYRENITWSKGLRNRSSIGESFFPLGNWLQPSTDKWDGFARLSRSGSGVVVLFPNHTSATTARIELPLLPAGRIRVRSITSGKDLGVFGKADWLRGIDIAFGSDQPAQILELTAESDAK